MNIPSQTPPVARHSVEASTIGARSNREASATQPGQGVQPAQSKCAHVWGPAKSLCYALQYGISV